MHCIHLAQDRVQCRRLESQYCTFESQIFDKFLDQLCDYQLFKNEFHFTELLSKTIQTVLQHVGMKAARTFRRGGGTCIRTWV
jgi:hypothetical protein